MSRRAIDNIPTAVLLEKAVVVGKMYKIEPIQVLAIYDYIRGALPTPTFIADNDVQCSLCGKPSIITSHGEGFCALHAAPLWRETCEFEDCNEDATWGLASFTRSELRVCDKHGKIVRLA